MLSKKILTQKRIFLENLLKLILSAYFALHVAKFGKILRADTEISVCVAYLAQKIIFCQNLLQ